MNGAWPVAKPVLTQNYTNGESTQISMFRLGFEPTIALIVRNVKIYLTEFVDS